MKRTSVGPNLLSVVEKCPLNGAVVFVILYFGTKTFIHCSEVSVV